MEQGITNARSLGDVVRSTDKKPKRYEPGRRCERCNAKLATDNPDAKKGEPLLCSPCRRPPRTWT